ncbi:MAG: hypothetical protein O7A62_05490, partial [Alphaproteobacteria bacterium]|nr:hypothetical protein [Alphaproteobacteria bacterium]
MNFLSLICPFFICQSVVLSYADFSNKTAALVKFRTVDVLIDKSDQRECLMVHLKTSSIFSAMALAAAICLVPAAAFAAKGGNGNGNGNGGGNGGGKGGNVVAVDDSGSVTVGSSVTIDVLDNDS